LSAGFAAATAAGRSWVLVGNAGIATVADGDFVEAIGLAGGYLPGSNWSRNSTRSRVALPYTGIAMVGWSLPTDYQLMSFEIQPAPDNGSSAFGFRMTNTQNV